MSSHSVKKPRHQTTGSSVSEYVSSLRRGTEPELLGVVLRDEADGLEGAPLMQHRRRKLYEHSGEELMIAGKLPEAAISYEKGGDVLMELAKTSTGTSQTLLALQDYLASSRLHELNHDAAESQRLRTKADELAKILGISRNALELYVTGAKRFVSSAPMVAAQR